MDKPFQETIATAEEASVGEVCLGFTEEAPDTSGTTATDLREVRHLCSDIPLRWRQRQWHLPRIPVAPTEDANFTSMAMDLSEEAFGQIWNNPSDDIWDRL
ncbi:MAG TPA: hypothetical protein ENN87_15160 [Phycisphaerales bacterium]|nr:hypothetical protein [Phycisphaerales bacterium]